VRTDTVLLKLIENVLRGTWGKLFVKNCQTQTRRKYVDTIGQCYLFHDKNIHILECEYILLVVVVNQVLINKQYIRKDTLVEVLGEIELVPTRFLHYFWDQLIKRHIIGFASFVFRISTK